MLRGKKNWRAFYANKKKEVRRKKIGELSRIDGFIRQQSKNVFFLSNKVIHSFLSLLCLSLDYMFHLFISLMFKLEPGSFLHLCFFSPSVVCVLATALSDEWSPPETTHEKKIHVFNEPKILNRKIKWTIFGCFSCFFLLLLHLQFCQVIQQELEKFKYLMDFYWNECDPNTE